MSTRTDEADVALRAALLATLAGAAQTVPTAAPPWPVTRARLVRIGRRRRMRAATAALGCAALVAAGALGLAGSIPGPGGRSSVAGRPEPPSGPQSEVGFPVTGQEAWLPGFRRAVAAHPPWWTSPDPTDARRTYEPVRPDQVQVQAVEELGGLRVVQAVISQTHVLRLTGRTEVDGDRARYGGPAGADPTAMIQLSDNPDAAAWPDPSKPGWVDVLSTRMVPDVLLHVRDATGHERTVPLGDSLMARVYAPGAQYVSLLNAQGDHELLFSLRVQPLDIEGMRVRLPPWAR